MRFLSLSTVLLAISLVGCGGDDEGAAVETDAAAEGDTAAGDSAADLGVIDSTLPPDVAEDVVTMDDGTAADTRDGAVPDAPDALPDAPLDGAMVDAADASMPDTADASMPDTADASTPDTADASTPDTTDTARPDTPDVASPADAADTAVSDTADAAGWTFSEPFSVPDNSPWPSPRWRVLGGVLQQDVVGGRSRLRAVPSMYSLARMGTDEGRRDVDVTFRVSFDEISTQGVGYYVRSNGGWLTTTTPKGQGYAVFLEGFRGSRVGVWKEIDGVEIELAYSTSFASQMTNGVTYGVHFRCTQASPTITRLQARVWVASNPEPSTWTVDINDTTPVLQNISGGMAIDSFTTRSSGTTAFTYVDDIVAFMP